MTVEAKSVVTVAVASPSAMIAMVSVAPSIAVKLYEFVPAVRFANRAAQSFVTTI